MKRFLIVFAALFLWISSMSSLAFAEEKQKDGSKSELADEAKSAVLIERDTGAVLYDKNSHERLPPASMTKIMTMILIMEAIQEGRLHWNDKVRASEKAASMGGSQVFLEPGEEMTVKEMLKAIAVGSANDASIAMAEHIAGSEEEFVKMMNKKAKELGLKDTKFQNPTGLPAKGHYSSAYDMALMAKELLKYPQITKYTGLYESYLRENTDKKFWLVNTNKLVKHYPGVDGLKTGFTNDAKYCLTATAKKIICASSQSYLEHLLQSQEIHKFPKCWIMLLRAMKLPRFTDREKRWGKSKFPKVKNPKLMPKRLKASRFLLKKARR